VRRSRRGEERLRLAPSCQPRLVPDSGWQAWRGRGEVRTSGSGLELDVPLSPASSLLHGRRRLRHQARRRSRGGPPASLPPPPSGSHLLFPTGRRQRASSRETAAVSSPSCNLRRGPPPSGEPRFLPSSPAHGSLVPSSSSSKMEALAVLGATRANPWSAHPWPVFPPHPWPPLVLLPPSSFGAGGEGWCSGRPVRSNARGTVALWWRSRDGVALHLGGEDDDGPPARSRPASPPEAPSERGGEVRGAHTCRWRSSSIPSNTKDPTTSRERGFSPDW
jgi:hypothetical protein